MGKLKVTIHVVQGGNINMQFKNKLRLMVTIGAVGAALSMSLVAASSSGAATASTSKNTVSYTHLDVYKRQKLHE